MGKKGLRKKKVPMIVKKDSVFSLKNKGDNPQGKICRATGEPVARGGTRRGRVGGLGI